MSYSVPRWDDSPHHRLQNSVFLTAKHDRWKLRGCHIRRRVIQKAFGCFRISCCRMLPPIRLFVYFHLTVIISTGLLNYAWLETTATQHFHLESIVFLQTLPPSAQVDPSFTFILKQFSMYNLCYRNRRSTKASCSSIINYIPSPVKMRRLSTWA